MKRARKEATIDVRCRGKEAINHINCYTGVLGKFESAAIYITMTGSDSADN